MSNKNLFCSPCIQLLIFLFLLFFSFEVKSQITVRETARQDYINNYTPSAFTLADMQWTGNIGTCNEGTVSQTVHNRIIQRMNYYRRMVGLEDQVVLDPALNAQCQKAALIMEANNNLSHDPPTNWTCWSQEGRDAAASSNLSLGSNFFFNPIDGYIEDGGGGNHFVGHRRCILYARGKTYGNGITPNAQSLWTFANGNNPLVYNNFIAYPPAGFIPRNLAFPRWSFSHPAADFANANVTMTGPNGAITLNVVSRVDNGFGHNTIVWEPVGIDNMNVQDVPYIVTISGITGAPQTTYTYTATLFDPAVGGGGNPPAGYTCATAIPISAAGTYMASAADQGNGAGDPGVGTHAIWYLFTPPTTGMINVTSCGIPANTGVMGGGHNHIYPAATTCATIPAALAGNGVFTTSNSCGNQTATNDIPVTAEVPIYIEWDDGVGGAAFTWNLEYVAGGACPANVTVSTATTMGNTLASASITTQGNVSANTAVFSAPQVNINGDFSIAAGQCFEINNVGCAYTGTLTCDGGGAGPGMGTCTSPYVLTCGTPFVGNTTNGTNNRNSYSGGMLAYGGPETIHMLTIPPNTPLTISLTSAVDMDLFIVTTDCNNTTIAFSGEDIGDESVPIPSNPNQMTYYMIVDGWNGVTGQYNLSCN